MFQRPSPVPALLAEPGDPRSDARHGLQLSTGALARVLHLALRTEVARASQVLDLLDRRAARGAGIARGLAVHQPLVPARPAVEIELVAALSCETCHFLHLRLEQIHRVHRQKIGVIDESVMLMRAFPRSSWT